MDHVFGDGWEAVELAPLGEAAGEKLPKFSLLREDFVLERSFCKDRHIRRQEVREQRSRDADLYWFQFWQQHFGGLFMDQDSMADLWLQRMSTTEACLMKTVLKDGM